MWPDHTHTGEILQSGLLAGVKKNIAVAPRPFCSLAVYTYSTVLLRARNHAYTSNLKAGE